MMITFMILRLKIECRTESIGRLIEMLQRRTPTSPTTTSLSRTSTGSTDTTVTTIPPNSIPIPRSIPTITPRFPILGIIYEQIGVIVKHISVPSTSTSITIINALLLLLLLPPINLGAMLNPRVRVVIVFRRLGTILGRWRRLGMCRES